MSNWREQGLCARLDTEEFFEKYETSVKGDTLDAHETDAFCQSCPVNQTCLATGVSGKEWGVWGGVYLKDGKIDKEFNSHKTKQDWFNTWSSLMMEHE